MTVSVAPSRASGWARNGGFRRKPDLSYAVQQRQLCAESDLCKVEKAELSQLARPALTGPWLTRLSLQRSVTRPAGRSSCSIVDGQMTAVRTNRHFAAPARMAPFEHDS